MNKTSLELFSGSKTISQVCMENNFKTISLDHNQKLNPSICCNILDFDPSTIPFPISFIWASPDCTYFSRLKGSKDWLKQTIKYRQYNYTPISSGSSSALAYLNKTIEIINFLNPTLWIIENPIGRLRHLDCMKLFAPYRYSINYNDWGFSYSKETDIYTNQLFCFPSKKVQRFNRAGLSSLSQYNRSKVPALLVQFIINNAIW